MRYKKYLRIYFQQSLKAKVVCPHPKFDEIVFYKRCLHCNAFIPFRSPEDIKRRGEFGVAPDPEQDHHHLI